MIRALSGVLAAVLGAMFALPALGQTGSDYVYDALGRLTRVTYEDGAFVDYHYDAAGNRTSVASSIVVPEFSVNDVSVGEGGSLVFTVTKTGAVSQSFSVNYATADGTATAGSDYTAASGTLTFASADTTKIVTVATIQDGAVESNETVLLNLSSPTGGATITDSQGVGTINNDDVPPSFSVNDVSVAEGGSLVFTVTKTGATSVSYSVNYATANGTAFSSDYTSTSGTLTFTSSQTTKTVSVATTSDNIYEADDTVLLNLSSPTGGATITDSPGVGTITNNDTAPAFSVNDVSVTEGGNLVFTVTKSGATAFSHNVNYGTANGTATAGSDYAATSGTLSFTSGQTSKTVTVTTAQDSAVEANETMYLVLSSATNGASISDNQGLGTINNDDVTNNPPVANGNYVSLGSGGPSGITIPNDYDPDGDSFTIVSVTSPTTYGTVTISGGGGSFLYTGYNPYSGYGYPVGDSFSYTIQDVHGAQATGQVYIILY